jgi:hypothetical protein
VAASVSATVRASVVIDVRDPTTRADALTLRLEDCRSRIRGRVHDEDGRPLATAVVSSFGVGTGDTPLFETAVAADGTFTTCRRGGLVSVRAPGYASASLVGAAAWDVTLLAEAIVEGTVTFDGQPVAGARVMLMSSELHGPLVAWSHDDGTFRITGVPPGVYHVAAAAERAWTPTGPAVHARAGETVRGLRIALDPVACRRIAGVVLADDQPVAGARVHVGVGEVVRTQLDGSFVASCGSVERIEARVAGYDVERAVIPAGTADLDDLVLLVTARPSITGRVTAGGQPVAGASVVAGDPRATDVARASTDTDGQFMLRVAPGTYSVVAEQHGRRRARPITINAERGHDVRGVELSLDIAGVIEGVVVDVGGDALSDANVSASGAASGAYTDADGRFAIEGLEAGSHDLVVRSHGTQLAPADGDRWPPVLLARDDDHATVRLVVRTRGGLAIRGRVVDDQGGPVAHAAVTAQGRRTMSDRDGAFVIDGLVATAASVDVVSPDGVRAFRGGVEVGGPDLTIVVKRAATLRVAVRGGDDDCQLDALGDRDSGGVGRSRGRDVAFDVLPPGDYQIVARCKSGLAQARTTLSPGETTTVELIVASAATVRVRVRTADGAPVAGAECRGGPPNPVADEPPPAGADGVVVLTDLPPGRVAIICAGPYDSASRGSRPYGEASADLAAGATANIDVTIVPAPP